MTAQALLGKEPFIRVPSSTSIFLGGSGLASLPCIPISCVGPEEEGPHTDIYYKIFRPDGLYSST